MFLLTLFLFFINISQSFSDDFFNENSHSTVEIINQDELYFYNNFHYLGIKINLQDGWKTYWKNPGDAGAAPAIVWKESDGLKESEILFPFPEKFIDHGVNTIGYEKTVVFPVKLKFDKKIKRFKAETIFQYLVCKEICIPVNKEISLDYALGLSSKKFTDSEIFDFYKKVPTLQNNYFEIEKAELSNDKVLKLLLKNFVKAENIKAFSYSPDLSLSTSLIEEKKKLFIEIRSDENISDKKTDLFLAISDGKNLQDIKIKFSDLEKPFNNSFYKFFVLAFLGGFLLNLMPCVLPVLSLKLMSLVNLRFSEKRVVRESITFTVLGILVSFYLLSALIILLKIFGNEVGWGFQFQNQYFIIVLNLVILIFAINLFGFFEIILPSKFLTKLNNINYSNSAQKHFFSGMFATLMATPCSAPFLGTAIGFSTMTSNLNVFFIFSLIALGFSLPYILVFFKPESLKLIPKPGTWMINFRFLMALFLLLTSCWLLSLLGLDTRFITIFFVSITSISLFYDFNKFKLIISGFIIFIILFFNFNSNKVIDDKLIWTKFDEDSLEKSISENNLILVDFTADWCITCQLNKKTTLENSEIKKFLLKNNVVLYRGDWTERDQKILNFIKKYDRFGIPVNLIFGPNQKQGIVLPEILTKDLIIDNINTVK